MTSFHIINGALLILDLASLYIDHRFLDQHLMENKVSTKYLNEIIQNIFQKAPKNVDRYRDIVWIIPAKKLCYLMYIFPASMWKPNNNGPILWKGSVSMDFSQSRVEHERWLCNNIRFIFLLLRIDYSLGGFCAKGTKSW